MFKIYNSCENPTRRNVFRLAVIPACTAKVITYTTLLCALCMFCKVLIGLPKQSSDISNFSYSPVLDDKLVSVFLHADTFGFNDTSVDREKMGNPRLKPVSRPVQWELACLCKTEYKYQLFSTF